MRAVDTNVLIRFITRDDERMYAVAARLLGGSAMLHVPESVILECMWTLKSVKYGYSREEIADALRRVFGLPCIELRSPDVAARILDFFEEGRMDYGDAMHLAVVESTCSELLTFDDGFSKKAKGRTPCRVRFIG